MARGLDGVIGAFGQERCRRQIVFYFMSMCMVKILGWIFEGYSTSCGNTIVVLSFVAEKLAEHYL